MTTETIEWKPIATAPKDRGRVLLWWPNTHSPLGMADRGHWEDERFSKRPRPHWFSKGVADVLGVRWMRANQPTHWAELLKGPL